MRFLSINVNKWCKQSIIAQTVTKHNIRDKMALIALISQKPSEIYNKLQVPDGDTKYMNMDLCAITVHRGLCY